MFDKRLPVSFLSGVRLFFRSVYYDEIYNNCVCEYFNIKLLKKLKYSDSRNMTHAFM